MTFKITQNRAIQLPILVRQADVYYGKKYYELSPAQSPLELNTLDKEQLVVRVGIIKSNEIIINKDTTQVHIDISKPLSRVNLISSSLFVLFIVICMNSVWSIMTSTILLALYVLLVIGYIWYLVKGNHVKITQIS